MITVQDEAIACWLAAVSIVVAQFRRFNEKYSYPSVTIDESAALIQIKCSDMYFAKDLRKYDDLLKPSHYGLRILVGENFYAFVSPQKDIMSNIVYENSTLSNSQWAKMNLSVLDLMSDDGTISIHSTDRDGGYKILTIAPYRKIDAVLCLPKEQLVGKAALEAWDKTKPETEVIAVTKQRVIEEAIASNQKTSHTYNLIWNGLLWEKTITGVLVGDREVLCITRNVNEYQRQYWAKHPG